MGPLRETLPDDGGHLLCYTFVINGMESWKRVGPQTFPYVVLVAEEPVLAYDIRSKTKVKVRKLVSTR